MRRGFFDHDGLRFSYLDSGGEDQPVLLLLHAHWMAASDFDRIMPALSQEWRMVALDQRGHGETDHGGVHSIDRYVGDIDALLGELSIEQPVVILGHSFGGMIANLYAAARPARVRGLIIEDVEVLRDDHDEFMLEWSGVYPTRADLEAKLGPRLAPYLRRSIREDADGWRLTFEPAEILESEQALNGDHWREWLSHDCPALIIRGVSSRVADAALLEEMVRRRPNTRLVALPGGHSVHVDSPAPYADAVNAFLGAI
jgi:pimeloyl-ACP methyl ester carboxylesterase